MPPGGSPRSADDVADADLVIAVDDLVDLPRDARHKSDARPASGGLGQDAGDGGMGALAGRSAGAIGHRDEIRRERRQPVDGVPQVALHLFGLGRKELEGDRGRFGAGARRCAADVTSVMALTNSTQAVATGDQV